MSEQFYIAENGQQTGPFTIDDIKSKNIQQDTLVWTEGLDNWTKAEHIPLLKEVLRAIPPPLPNTEAKTTNQQVPPPPAPTTTRFANAFPPCLTSEAPPPPPPHLPPLHVPPNPPPLYPPGPPAVAVPSTPFPPT